MHTAALEGRSGNLRAWPKFGLWYICHEAHEHRCSGKDAVVGRNEVVTNVHGARRTRDRFDDSKNGFPQDMLWLEELGLKYVSQRLHQH